MRFIIFCSILVLLSWKILLSQDIERLGDRFKGKAFTYNGAVSLNSVIYGNNGIANRREPFSYVLSGNVNFSLYGWNMPFRFRYSD